MHIRAPMYLPTFTHVYAHSHANGNTYTHTHIHIVASFQYFVKSMYLYSIPSYLQLTNNFNLIRFEENYKCIHNYFISLIVFVKVYDKLQGIYKVSPQTSCKRRKKIVIIFLNFNFETQVTN